MIDVTKWTPESMLEVSFERPDQFLIIKETLTRIGVASRSEKKLYQSCHIFHTQGRYFITHFKEMFLYDGKPTNIEENDIMRRNSIAMLLSDWGLITIFDPPPPEDRAPMRQIKVLSHREKDDWSLIPKYTIGNG